MEKTILCAFLSIVVFLFIRSVTAQEETQKPDLDELVQKLLSLRAIYGTMDQKEEEHKYSGDVTNFSIKKNNEERRIKNTNEEEKRYNEEEKVKTHNKLRQTPFRFPLFDVLAGYAENLTQPPNMGGGLGLMNTANIGNLGNLNILNPERLQALGILGGGGGGDSFGQISKTMMNTLQSSPLGTALNGSGFRRIAEGFLNPTGIFNMRQDAEHM